MIEVVHIVARVTTDMTRFNAGMASMEARAKTATAKMSLAGMRMTKYLTLPIAGIGYMAVKSATSFQSAMTLIQTQAGASAKDLGAIRKGIFAMSGRDVIQGPKDLADAYYHLQSVFGNTVSVAKKLTMLKDIGQLAQIGGSSTEDTASAVAGILRTRLKGAKNVEQVVRTINGIVGSGNMRMPQFVESTGTAVLQVARLLGMSLKQVGAAEAVFTDENMNANMSMTRLRTSLMMAVHPSAAAAKAMAQLGVNSLAIGEKMRSKKGFASTLDYLSAAYDRFVQRLEAKGASKSKALTEANALLFGSFGGSKGASIWATLVQQHAMYHQKIAQITNKEKNYNQDLAASNKTLSAQFHKAWASMQKALIDFGNVLAPIVLGAAKELGKLADAFTSLPKGVQKWIMAVAVGLAVLGPILIVSSSLIKIFTDIGGLLGADGALSLGFSSLLPLAIIAGVAALLYFAMKSKTFRKWLEGWGREIKGFFDWLGKDAIGPFFFKLYKWFEGGGKASRWATIVVPAMKAVGHTFTVLAKTSVHILYLAFKKLNQMIGYVLASLQKWENWGAKAGGAVFGLAQHLGLEPSSPNNDQAAIHKQAMKLARIHHEKVFRANERRRHQHSVQHHDNPVGPQPHHHNGSLVHIGEMHVRTESDAEIVSAKIARRVMIR